MRCTIHSIDVECGWKIRLPHGNQDIWRCLRTPGMLTTGSIGQSWLHNYTTASRVPLHPSLGPINADYPPPPNSPFASSSQLSHSALSFVHGGLAPGYPSLT